MTHLLLQCLLISFCISSFISSSSTPASPPHLPPGTSKSPLHLLIQHLFLRPQCTGVHFYMVSFTRGSFSSWQNSIVTPTFRVTSLNQTNHLSRVPQVPSPDPVTGKFGSINEEDNHGSINFSLSYSPEQGLLTVRLIQARDLVPCDFSGTADPYCRLCLLPNSKPQLQSKVRPLTVC